MKNIMIYNDCNGFDWHLPLGRMLIIFLCFLFQSVTFSASSARGEDHEAGRLCSVDLHNAPLKEALEKISKDTGFKIQISDGWEERPITVQLDGVPLRQGLRAVIQRTEIPSYAIVTDEKRKKIKIVVVDITTMLSDGAGNSGTPARLPGMPDLDEFELVVNNPRVDSSSIVAIPALKNGEASVSLKELEDTIARQLEARSKAGKPPVLPVQGKDGLSSEEFKELLEQRRIAKATLKYAAIPSTEGKGAVIVPLNEVGILLSKEKNSENTKSAVETPIQDRTMSEFERMAREVDQIRANQNPAKSAQ